LAFQETDVKCKYLTKMERNPNDFW